MMKMLRIFTLCLVLSLVLSGCGTTAPQPETAPSEPVLTPPSSTKPLPTEPPVTEPAGPRVPEFTGEKPIFKPYRQAANLGSLNTLSGDIVLLSVFLEDTQSEFSVQQETALLDCLDTTARWLETEAAKYGKETRIYTGNEDDSLVIHYRSPKNVLEYQYDLLRNMDIYTYYAQAVNKYNTYHVGLVIYLNKGLPSMTFPAEKDIPEEDLAAAKSMRDLRGFENYLDVCMLCCAGEEPINFATTARQILQLFGAKPLVFDCDDPEAGEMNRERTVLMDTYYPFEIMWATEPSDSLYIGEMTAFFIGCTESFPIKYMYFMTDPSYSSY